MAGIMLSVFITPVYTKLLLNVYSLGPQSKETSHVTLDTSKNTFESAPSPKFVTRQILKTSIIKESKYKVEDTT